ncbi:hypothetical protein HOK96_02415 [bacterium]|jgi:hypothetical protein|nr:hypothetical protein [bacterium]MBT3903346.1 hypothetical protein [bacterium]MBT4578228.1 hypothetical protein [bacterium]MBT5345874.1 hypothetical protein [bacterium]MBT6130641.1 hypothetical protein [bacterium]
MRLLCVHPGIDSCYVMLARSNDKGIGYLWAFLSGIIEGSKMDGLFKIVHHENIEGILGEFYIFTAEPYVYIGCKKDGLKAEERLSFKDDPNYYPFRTTKKGFIDLANQLIDLYDQQPSSYGYGIYIEETANDVWQVREMDIDEVWEYKTIAEPKTGFLPNDWKSKLK